MSGGRRSDRSAGTGSTTRGGSTSGGGSTTRGGGTTGAGGTAPQEPARRPLWPGQAVASLLFSAGALSMLAPWGASTPYVRLVGLVVLLAAGFVVYGLTVRRSADLRRTSTTSTPVAARMLIIGAFFPVLLANLFVVSIHPVLWCVLVLLVAGILFTGLHLDTRARVGAATKG